MKDEFIIINKTAIQKRIEEIEQNNEIFDWEEKRILEKILSQSIPLIPIIKNAFYNGGDMKEKEEFDFYISNLKLDI